MDLRLNCPFTMLIVGPTSSGKTIFTKNLLENKTLMLKNAPSRIVWCYSVWQPLYENLSEFIEFYEGLPDIELIKQGNFILVVDDLMTEVSNNEKLSQIFTKYSHHYNISCIYLLQNLFPKGPQARTISLNAHYIVLMKNNRDRAQIRHLASQVYPGNTKFLIEAFKDATQLPFSYLLLDFKNDISETIRIRTGIFPNESMFAYHPL